MRNGKRLANAHIGVNERWNMQNIYMLAKQQNVSRV